MRASLLTVYLIIFITSISRATDPVEEDYILSIQPTAEKITIDGKLLEKVWEQSQPATHFWIQSPIDGVRAEDQTKVWITHDDHFIYVGAILYDQGNPVVQSLKRDNFGESDEFAIFLDPLNEQANGYGFGVNIFGSQAEALFTSEDADDSWDNRWYSATHEDQDFWSLEMAIPFKTLRFKEGQREWGINFTRIEPGSNEVHVWSPIPRQFEFYDMGYQGTLRWEEPPSRPGNNISIIPYVSMNNFRTSNHQETSFDIGGDVKIGITPKLNLDLTYNPDFSQVEVDVQVTNLSRFNIFFPERRQFFIENSDMFNGYGQFAESPFYSRRIGLSAGGTTVPILYGARLTGNLSPKLRIGLFNIQTQETDGQAAQNYSAVTFQQRIWKRSYFRGLFLNRNGRSDGEWINNDYGRNLGGEFNYQREDGKVGLVAGYLHSFKNGFTDQNSHRYLRFNFNGQRFRTFFFWQQMKENYFADMGFTGRLFNFNPLTGEVVRVGFHQVGNMLDYYIYPKSSEKVNFHWSGLENFGWFNEDGSVNEWYTRLRHFIFFKNTSQLRFRLNNNYVNLLFPFAISETPLPVDQYNMTEFNVQFNTDQRKRLNTEMFVVYGEFYNGTKLTYRGELNFRVQPWGNFAIGLERNDIWLPDPYGNVAITLASSRININFRTNLFWTTFVQYNTQADNFNINSRLQWRFAPMSDVYLVYTDNYQVEGMFGPKDRSLVFKLNYWFTL